MRRLCSSLVLLPPLVAALELYARLGVETDASPRAIRKAYHAKALASHPDKAAASQKATAEQTFKALAEAYEVLSDRAMRAEYDRTGAIPKAKPGSEASTEEQRDYGYDGGSQQQQQQQQQQQWQQRWGRRSYFRGGGGGFGFSRTSFDEFSVRLAQQRMRKLRTLAQLRRALAPSGETARRFGLVAFYRGDSEMAHLRSDLRFPYPFAGWSHAQHGSGFWWEDALVTFAVRVSSSHPDTIELLRHFGLAEDSPMPTIAWVHRDEALTHLLERPRDHGAFLDWVYARVAMRFVITNLDHRPQKCWWINGHAAEPQATIAPGERFEQSSFLSHRWYCWPEETEGRTLTDDCATLDTYLGDVDAVDTGRVLELNATARCLDASSDCAYWKRNGECDRNYGFMQSKCRRSCGGCEKWGWLYSARLGVLHEMIRDTGVEAAEGLQRLPAAVRAQLEELCTRGRTGCDLTALRRFLRGCKDESDACASWARQGECEANPTYMGEACAKSCGSCGRPSGGASRRIEKEEL